MWNKNNIGNVVCEKETAIDLIMDDCRDSLAIKNIIFLDIDGVLNGYNFWNTLGWKIVNRIGNDRLKAWYRKFTNPFGIHESKVKRLAKIVRKTDAVIVMSSSWRFNWVNIPYHKHSNDFKKLIDLFNKYDINVVDITPRSPDGVRYKEINMWLNKNKELVRKFVILDDERFDLECFVGTHLVQTSSVAKGQMIIGHDSENAGLKNKHVRQAIKILK